MESVKIRYTNKQGKAGYAIIQARNIEEHNTKCFAATYKGFNIWITTDHGHGKPKEKGLKRYDIVVQNIENGLCDCDTWKDLHSMHSAIKYALHGACLIRVSKEEESEFRDY